MDLLIAGPVREGPPIIDDAGLSPDGRYRYWLTRCTRATPWQGFPHRGFVNFICLNPSTADATQDDPTVRRLKGFTRAWGYDGFWLTNLFAYRATQPADLCFTPDAIDGPDNLVWLDHVARRASLVVAAWGSVDGMFRNNVRFAQRRASHLCDVLLADVPMHALGFTKAGLPRHPLYMARESRPLPWIHIA